MFRMLEDALWKTCVFKDQASKKKVLKGSKPYYEETISEQLKERKEERNNVAKLHSPVISCNDTYVEF
jgi:hypothetical protein